MPKKPDVDVRYRGLLADIAKRDVEEVTAKDIEYGGSWKKRGGFGAYFTTVRKIDRLEEQVARHDYDIFAALMDTSTSESLLNTIRDLRGYLMLIESEHQVQKSDLAVRTMDPATRLGGSDKHRDEKLLQVRGRCDGTYVDDQGARRPCNQHEGCALSGCPMPVLDTKRVTAMDMERIQAAPSFDLKRCWRCSGFHLRDSDCPQDPGLESLIG